MTRTFLTALAAAMALTASIAQASDCSITVLPTVTPFGDEYKESLVDMLNAKGYDAVLASEGAGYTKYVLRSEYSCLMAMCTIVVNIAYPTQDGYLYGGTATSIAPMINYPLAIAQLPNCR